MRTAAQFLPSGCTHRIRPVADHSDPAIRRTPASSNSTERVSEITVPARHRQDPPGKEHPGPLDKAVFHRTGDSNFTAAHIAQCRKATVERVTQHLGCVTG